MGVSNSSADSKHATNEIMDDWNDKSMIKIQNDIANNSSNKKKRIGPVVRSELAYYKSIIGNSMDAEMGSGAGLLYHEFFPLAAYFRRPTPQESNPSFDPLKKERFIKETLPQWIQEYQLFMLNLAKKYKNTSDMSNLNIFLDTLVPLPISIQLLWRCHLLHPKSYHQDCYKHFGFLLSPKTSNKHLIISCQFQNQSLAQLNSLVRYRDEDNATPQITLDPRCDAFTAFKRKYSIKKLKKNTHFTDLNFNVTVMKQLEFMSKISCRMWEENFTQYLQQFINRYIKYLQTGAKLLDINQRKKDEIKGLFDFVEYDSLSPTYNIDFIWHLHMLYPDTYRRECGEITNGVLLDHDDISVGDEYKSVDDKDEESVSYWKYGKLGQFNKKHYVDIVMREEVDLLLTGYLKMVNDDKKEMVLPNDIYKLLFEIYFNVEVEMKELSASPPAVVQDSGGCKYGAMCCVGDHINLKEDLYQ